VIIDVRLNHGGDNTTYGALLDAMGTLSKTRRVVLLIGRATFSAAANFAADVDALPRVTTIGEATGGSPSTWGDASVVEIPSAGPVARVATRWHRYGRPGALAIRPDRPVPLTVDDFLAGRDPVLASALGL
jgi:C-terminal processing protease CtpA/Prc